jgi:glycosyltransferase involved in cell wall biosynthesis
VNSVSVIVATYQQPGLLRRCLLALGLQSCADFELLIADDGSDARTRAVIAEAPPIGNCAITHVWQADRGFRKTAILNRAILRAQGDYLVFLDGDCLAHPDFVREHIANAARGHYLNGSLIRLGRALSDCVNEAAIRSGEAFRAAWLARHGRRLDRRYLRLALDHDLRRLLNRRTPTRLYWLGSNASCFRDDAVAVNGFDTRFGYGFEDGDFGARLERFGVTPRTVRWTANALHLWHERPWSDPAVIAADRQMMAEAAAAGRIRAVTGLQELGADEECPAGPAITSNAA